MFVPAQKRIQFSAVLKGVFAQHKFMERLILRIMKLQLKVKSKHTVAIFKCLEAFSHLQRKNVYSKAKEAGS